MYIYLASIVINIFSFINIFHLISLEKNITYLYMSRQLLEEV